MRSSTPVFAASLVAAAVLSAAVPAAHATLIDILIFQDGTAAHRLGLVKPLLVPEPYELPLVSDGPLAGYYASIEPGWDGLGADQPAENRFGLLSINGVALQMLSADPGFVLFDSLLNPILETPTDFHVFSGENEGNPDLLWHEHLRFGIEPGAPVGQQYTATFQLIDVNGQMATSAPFSLTFVTTPEPGAALALFAALPLMLRRRG